jgi:hypothetical protein
MDAESRHACKHDFLSLSRHRILSLGSISLIDRFATPSVAIVMGTHRGQVPGEDIVRVVGT